MKLKGNSIILILVIFFLIFSFTGCNKSIKTEGTAIVLKDSINLFSNSEKLETPNLILEYGSIVNLVVDESKGRNDNLIKVIPEKSKKIYYAKKDDLYIVKSITQIKEETYYVLKTGMTDVIKGSYLYTKVETDPEGKLIPKDAKGIVWGTQFNILFIKDRNICPAGIFLEPNNYSIREGKFLYVQSVENKNLVGYVYATTIAFDAQPGIVINKSNYYTAALSSSKTAGIINPLEFITVFENDNGYYRFNCYNLKIYGKYIPSENISVSKDDVQFLFNLSSMIPNGLNAISQVQDETLKTEIINMINKYLNEHSATTSIKEHLTGFLNILNPYNEENNDESEENNDED